MFRRRPLARPLRRLLRPLAPPPPPIPPAALDALQRANHLMDTGAYPQAAEIYERLARLAAQRARPRQAANLFLQAARALLFARRLDAGTRLAQEGLTILADTEDFEAFDRLGARAVGDLNLNGLQDAARQLSEWINALRKGQPTPTTTSQHSSRLPDLPRQCPACGAPVRPNEVEWFDESTAECAYCGSILQA